jgi:hypothetical protein
MPNTKKRTTTKKTAAPRKPRRVTLEQVSVKAMEEPAFWRALRDDPLQALGDKGIALAPADARQLRAIMALDGKTVRVDLDGLMRARSRSALRIVPLGWIGLWSHLRRIVKPRQPRAKTR